MFRPTPTCAPAGGPPSASRRASNCTAVLNASGCASAAAGATRSAAAHTVKRMTRRTPSLCALPCMPERERVVADGIERRNSHEPKRGVHEIRHDEDQRECGELEHRHHLAAHARLEAHTAQPWNDARGEKPDCRHEVARNQDRVLPGADHVVEQQRGDGGEDEEPVGDRVDESTPLRGAAAPAREITVEKIGRASRSDDEQPRVRLFEHHEGDGERARVAEVCRNQEFVSGEYVFREGEPGNRLFLIVEGEVRISRTIPGSGEEALAVLKPGALFGEMSVFDRSERSTDAISNGGTKVLTIARSDFELLLDFNRELAYKVLWSCVRVLSMRLRSTNDSLRSFLAMSMF